MSKELQILLEKELGLVSVKPDESMSIWVWPWFNPVEDIFLVRSGITEVQAKRLVDSDAFPVGLVMVRPDNVKPIGSTL